MDEYSIRLATELDYTDLGEIMFEAVRDGAPQYTEVQRQAWAPEPRSGADWRARLGSLTVYVGENEKHLLGFMALANDYVDLTYIRPCARGKGIFRRLYHEVESLALRNNVRRLWTHASLTARPAFAAMGFQVLAQESVLIGEVSLDRFEMEKSLESKAG